MKSSAIKTQNNQAMPDGSRLWTPLNLTGNLKGFWVNANTIGGADGDAIASFQDDFGQVSFANATAAQQPQIEKNSLKGLTGIKWVLGSGDDNLAGTWSDGANIGTGDLYMIGLCSHDGSYDNNPTMVGVSFQNSPSQRFMIQRVATDDKFRIFSLSDGTSTTVVSDSAVSDNTPVIAGAVRTSGTSRLYIDGAVQTQTSTTAANLTNSAVRLGSETGQFGAWSGEIYEVIVGRGTLTDSDREKIEGYLAHKYGRQSSLPSTHTYRYGPPRV